MYERLGHPSGCNYYYAMRELLGLDPKRKEDQEFFQMLIDTGEIKRTVWGNGKVSDTQFDTDSILAYQQRVRRKVEKELKQLTEAIERMEKRVVELLEKLVVEVKKERREGEEWKKKG